MFSVLVMAGLVALGVDNIVTPCGNAICVGGQTQKTAVNLGGLILSTRPGLMSDGGEVFFTPADQTVPLGLRGNEQGSSTTPDVIIGSLNSDRTGDVCIASFQKGRQQVGCITGNGDLVFDGGAFNSGTITANKFVSTSAGDHGVADGGANFTCNANPAQSSPCLASFGGPLELGGEVANVAGTDANIYMGAMAQCRTAGPILSVLNGYGGYCAGGSEQPAFRVMVDGAEIYDHNLRGNTRAQFGGFTISSGYDGIFFNVDGGTFASIDGLGIMRSVSFQATGAATAGSCTLDGASPSKCTKTVLASTHCGCFATGTTAAAGINLAANLSSTTLQCTGPNASTAVVNYLCL